MSQKLHILFLSSWYPSRVLPTNGDFVQKHAEAVATKHQVTLIHVITDINLNSSLEYSEKIVNNVKTIIAYIPKKKRLSKLFLFYKSYLSAIKKIDDFDMIHLNVTYPKGLIALYLKKIKRKPYIITEHWTGYQYPKNKSIGFTEKILTRLIIKNASFICPVSNNLRDSMMKFGLKGNYFSIPNVVDVSVFNLSTSVPNNFTITHISHMGNEHKNVKGILNVISSLQMKIPNLHFNLIGDDSKKYKLLIKELNIKSISIIDQIPSKKVAEYLKNSTVFILFSNYENLPCVILEAFACGVPVISTNVGGINEFFPDNFGYLIMPNDEKQLEKSVLNVYKSKLNIDKEKMYIYAVKHFSIDAISRQFSNLYSKSLSN